MTITKQRSKNGLTISIEGRLDTITSPDLEKTINEEINNIDELTLDFEKLEYVSSAGLRVLLSAQKQIQTRGSMVIINVCDEVKQIFDITGFSDILKIK